MKPALIFSAVCCVIAACRLPTLALDEQLVAPSGIVGFVFCGDGNQPTPVYVNACRRRQVASLSCGEKITVLSRRGDMLQISVPPNGFPQYAHASAFSQQPDKFVPFDDDSGIPDRGAPECPNRPERDVTPPRAIFMPNPEYSDQARKQKITGVVVLSLTVGVDGTPRDVSVEKGVGYGLDEKAVEAVRRWRFTPALKDGQPVEKQIHVEVSFNM